MEPPPRFQFASLEDIEPQEGSCLSVVYVSSLKSFLNIGTHVLLEVAPVDEFAADEEEESPAPMVATIVDIAHSTVGIPPAEIEHCNKARIMVKLNILERFDTEMYRTTGKAKSLDNTSRHVPELYQTLDYVWVDSTKITDIVFVFTLSEIKENVHVPLQGMERGFAIRYWYNGETMKHVPKWRPFPCRSVMDKGDSEDDEEEDGFAESYSRRIWNGVLDIRDEIRSGLNSSSGKQGVTVHRNYRKVSISTETWHYFKTAMGEAGVHVTRAERKRCDKILRPFFKRVKRPRVVRTEFFSLAEDEEFDALSNLLGEASTFGYRQKWPKVGDGMALIRLNDIINVVTEMAFTFDGSHLNITIQYEGLVAPSRQGGDWTLPFPHVHAFIRGERVGEAQDTAVAPAAIVPGAVAPAAIEPPDDEDERDLLVEDQAFDNAEGTQSFTFQGCVPGSTTLVNVKRDSDGLLLEMAKADVLLLIRAKLDL